MGFPRQEYRSGLSFPSPDLLNLGLLRGRQILYHLSHQGSPSFSRQKVQKSQKISKGPINSDNSNKQSLYNAIGLRRLFE